MDKPENIPQSASAIQKLAHKEYQKREKKKRLSGSYLEGDANDKVWDNYQLTKGLKRQFKDIRTKNKIIASSYLRSCIKILIKKKGNHKKALTEVEKQAENL